MTFHGSTGMSPFKVVYGWDPSSLLRLVEVLKVNEVNMLIKEKNEILDKLKENLKIAQERMKRLVDQNK